MVRHSLSKPRKLKSKLRKNEFYCVDPRCRGRVAVPAKDIKIQKDRRGRQRMVANHPQTGVKLYKYVSNKLAKSRSRSRKNCQGGVRRKRDNRCLSKKSPAGKRVLAARKAAKSRKSRK